MDDNFRVLSPYYILFYEKHFKDVSREFIITSARSHFYTLTA